MKSLLGLFAQMTQISGGIALVAAAILNAIWLAFARAADRKVQATQSQATQLRSRLRKLSGEIKQLETCPTYARGRRSLALIMAYDRVLSEACQHAGISIEQKCRYQDLERLRRERALGQLGWVW